MRWLKTNILWFVAALALLSCNNGDSAEDAADIENNPDIGTTRQDNTNQEYKEENSMRYDVDSVEDEDAEGTPVE